VLPHEARIELADSAFGDLAPAIQAAEVVRHAARELPRARRAERGGDRAGGRVDPRDALSSSAAPPDPSARHALGSDPFTRGAYTYVALGAAPPATSTRSASLTPTASSSPASTRAGPVYADGALATGVREAKRLLQQPSGLLPEPGALPLALAGAFALWLARRRGPARGARPVDARS
jgi:hypothetical protein